MKNVGGNVKDSPVFNMELEETLWQRTQVLTPANVVGKPEVTIV